MSGRATVLSRIRRALADVPPDERPEDTPVLRDYGRTPPATEPAGLARLLATNLADYRARVHRSAPAELPGLIGELLRAREASRVVVPPGVPAGWLPPGTARWVREPDELSLRQLDAVDAVVTGCAVAVADTGTLVLDGGPGQGRRRDTLVPDHHICVVRVPEQLVASVAEALPRLDPRRPLTWISGPSATSDIELDRVEGVHGPRLLEVVLVERDDTG
ncbi:lactate utilization protein C [Streptomyces sp. AJS327]|uniref:LutC/YkgG family protein n=1 Tax=Streptomyces sp. AJS327 TaxID=2545265 RepID=UPI0015DFE14F|nr:lactate utilization protein C [Streptomyces sp. AJS327]MBA0052469.1 lactate utilization protein C [Streptomyces sp. AJS327]